MTPVHCFRHPAATEQHHHVVGAVSVSTCTSTSIPFLWALFLGLHQLRREQFGSLAASLCSGVRLCLYAVCRQCTETFHILDNQRLSWHTNPLRLSSHRILFPQAQTCTTVEDFLHFHWNEEVNIFLHCQKKKCSSTNGTWELHWGPVLE